MAEYVGGILSDQIKFYFSEEKKIINLEKITEGSSSTFKPAASADLNNYYGYVKSEKKWYQCTGSSSTYSWAAATNYNPLTGATNVPQLQAVPSLGGTTSKIDVTCLDSKVKKTINGLIDYGDSIDFTFLYDPENYQALDEIGKDNTRCFLVEFKAPNEDYTKGDLFLFNAKCSVAINDVAVDSALTFTASLAPQSEILRQAAVAA